MSTPKPKPILAMWSGPRNLSTAMMRAWENRADTQVVDEPFYAAYLQRSGVSHPMRAEVLLSQPTDLAEVIQQCTTPLTGGFFYQKHMTHHMLTAYPLDWLVQLQHCFLLRDPREVLLSYARKREAATLEAIGLPQQLRLYRWVKANLPQAPLVVDAKDFLHAPQAYLEAMCAHVGLAFDPAMLSWPAGRRASDGVWAAHWYDAVWQSTGFAEWRPRSGELTPAFDAVQRAATEIYRELWAERLIL